MVGFGVLRKRGGARKKNPHFQLLGPNIFGFICFLFGFSFSSRSDDVRMSDKDFDHKPAEQQPQNPCQRQLKAASV